MSLSHDTIEDLIHTGRAPDEVSTMFQKEFPILDFPIVIDISETKTTLNRKHISKMKQQPIPASWLLDVQLRLSDRPRFQICFRVCQEWVTEERDNRWERALNGSRRRQSRTQDVIREESTDTALYKGHGIRETGGYCASVYLPRWPKPTIPIRSLIMVPTVNLQMLDHFDTMQPSWLVSGKRQLWWCPRTGWACRGSKVASNRSRLEGNWQQQQVNSKTRPARWPTAAYTRCTHPARG